MDATPPRRRRSSGGVILPPPPTSPPPPVPRPSTNLNVLTRTGSGHFGPFGIRGCGGSPVGPGSPTSSATRLAEKLWEDGAITLDELNEVVSKDMQMRVQNVESPLCGSPPSYRSVAAIRSRAHSLATSGDDEEPPPLRAMESGVAEAFRRARGIELERRARFAKRWRPRALVWERLAVHLASARASNSKIEALLDGQIDAARRYASDRLRARPPAPAVAGRGDDRPSAWRCHDELLSIEQVAVALIGGLADRVEAMADEMGDFVDAYERESASLLARGAGLLDRAAATNAAAEAAFDELAAQFDAAAKRDGADGGELRSGDPLCAAWVAKELRWQWARRASAIQGWASSTPLCGLFESTRALERRRTAVLTQVRVSLRGAVDALHPGATVDPASPYRCEEDLVCFLNTGGDAAARNVVATAVLAADEVTPLVACPESLAALFTTHSVVKVGVVQRQRGGGLGMRQQPWVATTMVLTRFGLLQLFDYDPTVLLDALRAAAKSGSEENPNEGRGAGLEDVDGDGGGGGGGGDGGGGGGGDYDDEGGACAAAAPVPALPVLDALAMNLTPFKTIVLGPRWGAQQGATETRFAVKRASPKGFFEAFAQPALELIFDAPSDVEAIAWTHAIERTSRSIAV